MSEHEPPTFVCLDCEHTIFVFGWVEQPIFPVCKSCRFIRDHPGMPDHVKELLRGEGPEL